MALYRKFDARSDPAKGIWSARWLPADGYPGMSNEALQRFFEPKDKARAFLMGDRAHICESGNLPFAVCRLPLLCFYTDSTTYDGSPSPRSAGDLQEQPKAGPWEGARPVGHGAGGPAGTRMLPGRQPRRSAPVQGEWIRQAGRVGRRGRSVYILDGPAGDDAGTRV